MTRLHDGTSLLLRYVIIPSIGARRFFSFLLVVPSSRPPQIFSLLCAAYQISKELRGGVSWIAGDIDEAGASPAPPCLRGVRTGWMLPRSRYGTVARMKTAPA